MDGTLLLSLVKLKQAIYGTMGNITLFFSYVDQETNKKKKKKRKIWTYKIRGVGRG